MPSPQIGAALEIIKRNGGKISHSDFLEQMGFDKFDPRGSDIIKKVTHRTRHALFLNERGYLTLTKSLDDIPSDELQAALSDLMVSFRRFTKVQENGKIWMFSAIGFILGFLFAFYFTETTVEFDASNLPLCLTSAE